MRCSTFLDDELIDEYAELDIILTTCVIFGLKFSFVEWLLHMVCHSRICSVMHVKTTFN